jgi:membrane associated rhomboid family serine protease
MDDEKKKFIRSLYIPSAFIVLIWILKLSEVFFNINLVTLGIYPGELFGLKGVLFSPLLHSNFDHLLSNTLPILFLGTGILYFYKDASIKVIAMIYIIPGIFIWLFARPSYHIGASTLIYGFVTFLFFSGVIRRDTRSIALALLVTFLYGSLVWGVLPLKEEVSWEGHLFGSLTGLAAAIIFRKSDPYKRYEWEDEEDDIKID